MEVILAKQQNIEGQNRVCSIKARTDSDAIKSWLNEYIAKYNTYISYKKELKKFTLWLDINKLELKELKELKELIHDYIAWLKNPPQDFIISGDKDVQKQIFKAAMSYKGVQYNIRVVNSLLNYLSDADYIYKNPIKLIKQFSKFDDSENRVYEIKAKILEDNEFQAVIDALKEMDESTPKDKANKMRTQLIIAMLYYLGLRISELAGARWNQFKIIQGKCWFYLIGKGGKPGQIPVSDELISIIKNYRSFIGLNPDIEQFDNSYILPSKHSGYNLSSRRIREIVKELFNKASEKFDNKEAIEKLKNATPHDFRHLLASNLDRLGASIIDTKEILRHSSEKTTELYRHSKESLRHDLVQLNNCGINDVIKTNSQNYTKIEFSVECRKEHLFRFEKFINHIFKFILKDIKLVNDISIEKILSEFKLKAGYLRKLKIEFILYENDIVNKEYLEKLMMNLARARCVLVDLCIED